MPLTPFQGVLVAPYNGKYVGLMSQHNEVSEALIDVLPKEFYNHYTYPDIRPFLWKGYQVNIKYTYVVDMKIKEEMWNNLEKDTRNLIRQHEGIKITTDNRLEFAKMYTLTFLRQSIDIPVKIEALWLLFESMQPDIYTSEDAGVAIIKDSKRAYYLLGASIQPNQSAYVLWHALCDQYLKGVKEMDLVGCNSRERGAFKKQFGGRLMPYYGIKAI